MEKKLITGLIALVLSSCRIDTIQPTVENRVIPKEYIENYYSEQAEDLYSIGLALYKKGAHDHALEYFKKSLRKNPEYAPANDKIAECYLFKGKYDLALYYARIAVKNDPENPFYKATLDLIQREKKKHKRMKQKRELKYIKC